MKQHSKIINFHAGPGGGKTTMAGELFAYMKRNQHDVVYLDETASHIIRSKSRAIDDQMWITATQHHKQWSIYGEVEWIITDSPITLGCIYIRQGYKEFENEEPKIQMQIHFEYAIRHLFNMYNNINFFIDRGDRPYKQVGRRQDEVRARQIDKEIHDLLIACKFEFTTVKTIDDVIKHLEKEYNV